MIASRSRHTLAGMPSVVIKLRDLDSDARTETVLEINRVPDNGLRQAQHLAELVAAHHPDARQRSYADGVASFVDRRHLIVARYVSDREAGASRGTTADEREDRQDQLFAA